MHAMLFSAVGSEEFLVIAGYVPCREMTCRSASGVLVCCVLTEQEQ